MGELKIVPELEKIIKTNLSLVDAAGDEESIKRLRVGKTKFHGVECIVVSPDNMFGKLGFSYNALATPNSGSIKYFSTDAQGITLFDTGADAGGIYIIVHSSRKTWPKNVKYEKVSINEYNVAKGYVLAQK